MKRSNAGDFLIGVVAIVVLDAAAFFLSSGPGSFDAWFGALVCAEIALIIGAITRERPHIALGIVAAAVIPQLVFFWCASLAGRF